jgi:hypothetical protein
MRYISTVTIYLVLLLASGIDHADDSSVMKAESENIARALETCPLWTDVSEDDVERRKQITETYVDLAQYDTAAIRAGIALYLQKYTNPPSYQYYQANDKVYALTRVVFKIPHGAVSTNRSITSFDGADQLWPFTIDNAGRIQLTGVAGFRSGPAPDVLAEFDHMSLHLGRRFPVKYH